MKILDEGFSERGKSVEIKTDGFQKMFVSDKALLSYQPSIAQTIFVNFSVFRFTMISVTVKQLATHLRFLTITTLYILLGQIFLVVLPMPCHAVDILAFELTPQTDVIIATGGLLPQAPRTVGDLNGI